MEAPSLDFSSSHASHCARFGWSCPSQGSRWYHLPSRAFYRLREPLIVDSARIILRSPCNFDSLSPVETAPDMPDQPPAPGMRTRSSRKQDDYESLSQTETTPTQASQDCEDCDKRHTTCAPRSNNAATSRGDDSSLGRRQQSVHTPYLSPLSTNRHSADTSVKGRASAWRQRSDAFFSAKNYSLPFFLHLTKSVGFI